MVKCTAVDVSARLMFNSTYREERLLAATLDIRHNMYKGLRRKKGLVPKSPRKWKMARIKPSATKSGKKASEGKIRSSKPIRKRRRKGKITKLKDRLWELCKQITRAECIKKHGKLVCFTSEKVLVFPKDAHTGHYITSSWCSPELRYDLKNLRVQSYDENINKNGNTLQFRENLIRDHGVEYVDELWARNKATKGKTYPITFFLEKEEEYKKHLTTLLEELQGVKKEAD